MTESWIYLNRLLAEILEMETWRTVRSGGLGWGWRELMEGQGEEKRIWILIEFSSFPHVFICSLVHSVCAWPLILTHRGVQPGHYSVVHLRPHSRVRRAILTEMPAMTRTVTFSFYIEVNSIQQDFCHLLILNNSISCLHMCVHVICRQMGRLCPISSRPLHFLCRQWQSCAVSHTQVFSSHFICSTSSLTVTLPYHAAPTPASLCALSAECWLLKANHGGQALCHFNQYPWHFIHFYPYCMPIDFHRSLSFCAEQAQRLFLFTFEIALHKHENIPLPYQPIETVLMTVPSNHTGHEPMFQLRDFPTFLSC